ncbi:MAG: hypothetical protein RMK51_00885 [Meiothermus sp.]|uniref:hypothetical protein n=1 Tax=Meiothermus sp. TaxID=1955249 RepID=UPI0025F9FD2D|nr:hypothetical protein [Meiothermus sp.]MCS7068855.1 hypothetical protein [Meiothermus sp.]MCX7803060.1 hypothetical protein [Meiothermus ruber]MDW8424458.1 hypothetical protein [Meiothermus sp.]
MRHWLLFLPILAACGGGTNPPPSPGDFQISLGSQTLTLGAGGSGSVPVTLEKTGGFQAEVSLALVRIPSSLQVSGSFSPNPIQTTSTLNLSLGSSLGPGTYTLLVRASALVNGQTLKRERELTLTVLPSTTFAVTGQVRNYYGKPLAGVPVCQGSTCVDTDAQGRFALGGVSAPYRLSVRPSSTEEHTFEGLTRPDPLLLLFTTTGGSLPERSANLGGSLTPQAGFPNPAHTVAQVVFEAPQAKLTQFVLPGHNLRPLFPGQGPAYSLNAVWHETSSVEGRVHVLQWKYLPGAPGIPTSFLAYGSAPITLSQGASATLNVGLSPIETGALTVNLTNPSGLTLRSRQLYANLGSRSLFLFATNAAASPLNLSWATPVIPGKTLTFAAFASEPDGRTLSLQQNGLGANGVLDVELPVPPALSSPAPNQSGVATGASLRWSRPAGSISILSLAKTGQPTRLFYTDGTALTPGLQGGSTYNWLVLSVGPFESIDAFAGTTWAGGYPTFGWDTSFFSATSALRSFSTAP